MSVVGAVVEVVEFGLVVVVVDDDLNDDNSRSAVQLTISQYFVYVGGGLVGDINDEAFNSTNAS